jgi:hypothetical protein
MELVWQHERTCLLISLIQLNHEGHNVCWHASYQSHDGHDGHQGCQFWCSARDFVVISTNPSRPSVKVPITEHSQLSVRTAKADPLRWITTTFSVALILVLKLILSTELAPAIAPARKIQRHPDFYSVVFHNPAQRINRGPLVSTYNIFAGASQQATASCSRKTV